MPATGVGPAVGVYGGETLWLAREPALPREPIQALARPQSVSDVVTLQQYCALLPDGPSGLEEVMRLVAAYTRRMHDSGLWHRDLVSSNLLLTGPPGHRQVYLVDLNRARRLPYVPAVLRAMDL